MAKADFCSWNVAAAGLPTHAGTRRETRDVQHQKDPLQNKQRNVFYIFHDGDWDSKICAYILTSLAV